MLSLFGKVLALWVERVTFPSGHLNRRNQGEVTIITLALKFYETLGLFYT
ncbi:hypothetical protein [Psychroserpens burtonensis]|nr:hypothetical protein [Psychroserpens burtonensis]